MRLNKITSNSARRNKHNFAVRKRNLERADPHDNLRAKFAEIYLSGKGLEIGALHKPLNIPENKVTILYVDRLSNNDLKKQYPAIDEPFIEVDIVDDGETLKMVKTESQDFIIACHFYEHCANPIQTLENLLRVVKPGGGLLFGIPDKRFTFDIKRKVTPFTHILEDYKKGPQKSKLKHFEEWVTLVDGIVGKKLINSEIKRLIDMDYSIHYHVWDYEAILDHFVRAKKYLKDSFEIEFVARNLSENIVYLKKVEK